MEKLKLEGRTKVVVDRYDNVWWRSRSNDPWRSAIDDEAVYKMNEDMDEWCRDLEDEPGKYVPEYRG